MSGMGSWVLCFLFLFGSGLPVPIMNDTNWIKDLILTADVVEESAVPAMPLLFHFNDKSYYIGSIVKLNFFEAEQFCSYHGMRLLSITSNDENVFLGQSLIDHGFTSASDIFWTSGTRLPDEEHWIWLTTGSRIDFTNWAVGEPNNVGKVEKCLEVNRIKIPKKRDLFWGDQNCAGKLYFICEYKRPKTISYVIDRLNKLVNASDIEIVV
ncbi:perlucin-like [Anoplophora glabripennis]|uniref:perlucin-like n=1 Tax=Anoplophora glabripennis TaxID=217634 RepID=UPI0008743A5F|nr:perlucin-like [Anoplophora glabripennis]